MKHIRLLVFAGALALIGALSTGCMTSRQLSVSPTGTVTTNTVINTNMLALDCAAVQVATATTVSLLVNNPKNANLIPPLKSAQVAIDGVLNGVNSMTMEEVITMLKAQNNPQLTLQIEILLKNISALEQSLIYKYGPTVGGQIAIAMAQAVDSGLIIGLSGH